MQALVSTILQSKCLDILHVIEKVKKQGHVYIGVYLTILIHPLLWHFSDDKLRYDHGVLKAFSPYYAFEYLIRNKEKGWHSLGGVMLCFTGVEALFADIGAFSRHAIQLSWLSYTYPCILLAYCGQAAYISVHPEAYSNPFYNSVPHGWLIFSLILAILAAIVASQAIITATFQVSCAYGEY